ncbi:RNA polymerase sigma factor [Chitinophaga barathri]|uniref:Uncharacterized protein n=1 Tax=Chitinophaga barathri TaxID=1647451 RepID=A0A3N4MI49_9BACT|nr:sigma factor-like helix-turn-helix DNA-binding protein [Chitinophaga barathri]RPD43115.1 hypothetical protein EG028_02135 [Chitinophaga barathri]
MEKIMRFGDGSAEDFQELYLRLHDKLFYYASTFVGNEDAKDVVQDVFVSLIRKDFASRAHLEGCAMIAVKNRCEYVSRHSKNLRLKKMDIEASFLISDAHCAMLANIRARVIELVESELLKLSDIDRKIIRLYVEGYHTDEIGVLLATHPKTIKNRFSIAKRYMREELARGDWALVAFCLMGSETVAWLSNAGAG